MKNRILISVSFLLGSVISAFAQDMITVEEYIARYKEIAVEEMRQYHIPASITLAQGILESNCGNSPLAREANNHFGIKCHKEWTGKTFHQDDDEVNECFRKYNDPEESYRDHSLFLVTRDRYNALFDLAAEDYKGWAYGLKQAGYATNPKYPELLIKIIEENGLQQFDNPGSQLAQLSQQPAVGSRQSETGTQTTHKHSKSNNSNNSNNSNSKLKTQNSKLSTGPPVSFTQAGTGGREREIFINNGVKFIYARDGDDCFLIADEFGIYTWQIYRYNEMSKDEKLSPGQKVYLEKKRKRGDYDFHQIKTGEDLRSVSQDYGIRLKSLERINGIIPGSEVLEGEVLILR